MTPSTQSKFQAKRQDLNPCTVRLDVVCGPEQVEAGFNQAARQFAKKMKVPGFRPGTAPRPVIERLVNQDDYFNTVVETVVGQTLKQAMADEGLTADKPPAVTVTKFDPNDKVLQYSAKVPLPPVVKLGEYKGIEVRRSDVTVTEEEIDKQIEDLRRRKGHREAVVGGIQPGDNAVVNIRLASEEGEGRTFMVVVGQTFPTLDEALTGMAPEELKSVRLEFPKTFQESDWAGQAHDAILTVRSATTLRAPALDDEFAKSLDAGNVEELREKIREGIRLAKESIVQEMVNEQLFDKVVAASEIHVPDTAWESVAAQRLREQAAELAQSGKSLEDYAKENGMTLDELVQAQQNEAKMHVQRAVLIEHIFRAENMQFTNEEVNRQFLQIAYENRVPQNELRRFAKKYGPAVKDEILFRSMYQQVVSFLNQHAKVVHGDQGDHGAAPKKAAPKKKKSE
jgi:trigger factor